LVCAENREYSIDLDHRGPGSCEPDQVVDVLCCGEILIEWSPFVARGTDGYAVEMGRLGVDHPLEWSVHGPHFVDVRALGFSVACAVQYNIGLWVFCETVCDGLDLGLHPCVVIIEESHELAGGSRYPEVPGSRRAERHIVANKDNGWYEIGEIGDVGRRDGAVVDDDDLVDGPGLGADTGECPCERFGTVARGEDH
jgi:hypothetical protein